MDKSNLEILNWQLRFNINLIEILNTLFEVEPLVIGPGGLTFDLILHFLHSEFPVQQLPSYVKYRNLENIP